LIGTRSGTPEIPLSGGLVTIRAKEPESSMRTRASCPKVWESSEPSVRDRASDRSMFRGVTNKDGGVARDRHLEPRWLEKCLRRASWRRP
jgi:hypothetical protein